MKNQVLVGYLVFKKNQVRVESGSGPRKNVPENTCITSEVIHRLKGLEYVSTAMPYFPRPQHFSAFLSCDELQINQYCLGDWQVPQLTYSCISIATNIEITTIMECQISRVIISYSTSCPLNIAI